jgi:C4-dicarboxylate transporter DctM subunit
MTGLILIFIVLLLIFLGQPIFILIGAASAYLLLSSGVVEHFSDLAILVEKTRDLADKDLLLAIPFFVLAGSIMTEGDIARRLIGFARALFCWLPGGLAISAIFACVFFAAISGSSPVTVIAIGSIMYPAMVKEGYGERFSSGLVTSAGSLGILIPPSIPMIVYAIVDPTMFQEPEGNGFLPACQDTINCTETQLGVTDLFLAGVLPGLIIAIIFSFYSISVGLKLKVTTTPFSLRRVLAAGHLGIWSLLLPVLILGGIYSGAFTATAAACVAVVYSIIVERFIHRSIRFIDLKRVVVDSMVLIGALLLILALAQGFNTYIHRAEVAANAVKLLDTWQLGPVGFLLFVNLILLVAGCFMDVLSAILILVPLLSPIAHALGIHPLHLGVVFIVNLEIGYLTPPLGINLFVSSTLFKKGIGEIVKGVVPFTALMLVGLVIITYVPSTSLGLVSLYHGGELHVPLPEPHQSLDDLESPEALQFLAGLASPDYAGPEANGVMTANYVYNNAVEQADSMRVRTMAELLAGTTRTLERAAERLEYDSLQEMLNDYRSIYRGDMALRDLAYRQSVEVTP